MLRAQYQVRGPVPQDVIEAVEFETPAPAEGEVLLEMLAAPINPSDVLTLTGHYGTAPLTMSDQIRKPMLVVQGRNDPRVPVTESDQIVETLQTTKTPVWYLVANDEGHGFRKKRNADFQFYTTVLFVERFLLN